MTTHLSARLAWHDRGWDGHVCAAPHLNTSCVALRHIRKGRDDERERRTAGMPFADLPEWLPPCAQDAAAFAPQGYNMVYRDPYEPRGLPPAHALMPPHSCAPIPYRWLREDNAQAIAQWEGLTMRPPTQPESGGWVNEPDRQSALLRRFWEKLEPGASLIFYYATQDNPVDEDASRVIVGVGRIAEIGPQLYYGRKPGYQDDYPVWSRRVTQDYPLQGVRIPYQEYLAAQRPVGAITCPAPVDALLSFSYAGEHVSDDTAVAVLERVIQSIEQVRRDGYVAGDWAARLKWLNDALAEVWNSRGAFPGLGGVLQYLGFERGSTYQRETLAPLAQSGANSWEHVQAALEGATPPERDWVQRGLAQAGERWRALPVSRRELLAELTRFELSEDQVRRVADPRQRANAGLIHNDVPYSDAEIRENPYLIVESYVGAQEPGNVSLETIDHGMAPEGAAAWFSRPDASGLIAHDDRRRVRAVAYDALQRAANEGDTLLPLTDLLDRIRARFPERRACQPDPDVMAAEAAFYAGALWLAFDHQPPLAALQRLRRAEEDTVRAIQRLAPMTHAQQANADTWRAALEEIFGAPETERAHAALDEKVVALDTLFRERLTVLTGGAGTGKTSVLRVLLDGLERLEGKQSELLLAPTGKARVRLLQRTGRPAKTIHQFLFKQGWFQGKNFTLRESSEREPHKAMTVVIDECSMISADLFATLLRALDLNTVRRLVLVGDPSQLPPIGPGRPFVDIIAWLGKHHPECIVDLRVCMRTSMVDGKPEEESATLALAESYRADGAAPGDDEILAALARGEATGDLDVVFWRNHDDLLAKLNDRMATHLGIILGDPRTFDRSLGIPDNQPKGAEAWQILSPTRKQLFGADELNYRIQRLYRGRVISEARSPRTMLPLPFGDQEIVVRNKVIQIRNQRLNARPWDIAGVNYVANGEIGVVGRTAKSAGGDTLDVAFSTQPEVTYRYRVSDVNDNLELAYALTVHKAQGSDFDTVFFIVPRDAATLSREMIYTGLTRFRKRMVLLIEGNVTPLIALRSPLRSSVYLRNTFLFTLSLRPEGRARLFPEDLIHRTTRGILVRSKSEVIVADILDFLGVSYEYEKPLYARDNPADFRLPDFTVSYEGETYYWEHLGMLALPSYREAWERKLAWYEANGYADRLIISRDGPDGGIDAEAITQVARDRIL